MTNDKNCTNCKRNHDTCNGVNIPDFKCDKWLEKTMMCVSPCEYCANAVHKTYTDKETGSTQEWDECGLAEKNGTCSFQAKEEESDHIADISKKVEE